MNRKEYAPFMDDNYTGLILVVEDESSIRTGISMILETQGYDIISAENGLQAVEILRQHRPLPDLILSDITIPSPKFEVT
ncbi:MAG: response regulator [Gemmatimonadetes bacterium]|nr:MAG: response regulator [Gemmatimonadota bacterium]